MIDPGGLKVARRGPERRACARSPRTPTASPILNTNDLDKGLTRIADDMASYYLLGYYATNTKPDGRFRRSPFGSSSRGSTVRARKGYRAPSEADIKPPAASTKSAAAAAATPVQAALDQLGRIRPDRSIPRRRGGGAGPDARRCGWSASFVGDVAAR